ncbi:trehalose-phosphatase [Streptosporangiaceae bacterium NEAU-GS5]|nr:trehalose-phosphatase [Streptosporangiaceae bacterium NEAU-GS5]
MLGLDFDGTLSPIVADPAQAWIHPGAPPVLARLGEWMRAIVIITGRPPLTVLELGPGLADVPGLTILGHYGRERWAGGKLTAPPPHPGLDLVRRALPALAPSQASIEDKGQAMALHTRRCPDPQGTLDALRESVARLAAEAGLVVEPGRYVLELRPPGMDKGQALTAFLREKTADSVIFVGDDLGDLAAFDAVEASGLPGLKVCSGSAEVTALAERADLVVDGPAGVVTFLEELDKSFAIRTS